jgi:ankyrin repeat-rich membrane spanning protein
MKVQHDNLTVNAVLIAMASVVGLALVLNCRTWWQVADSVLNSQRKRLHSAANKMHKLKSEGFMKVGCTANSHTCIHTQKQTYTATCYLS